MRLDPEKSAPTTMAPVRLALVSVADAKKALVRLALVSVACNSR